VQSVMSVMRRQLRSGGTFFPVGSHESTAHHAFAWQILGWPLEGLGLSSDLASFEVRLRQWLAEAEAHGCRRMVLSSEDFSYIELSRLLSILGGLANRVTLLGVRRSTEELSWSLYKELLRHGLAQSYSEVVEQMTAHFEFLYLSMERSGSVEILTYDRSMIVRDLVVALLGSEKVVEELGATFVDPVNTSLTDDQAAIFLSHNRRHSPHMWLENDRAHFPPRLYSQIKSIQQQMRLAGLPI
jgi:hypothetical protein